ncbi:vitamin K epoxide reductase family protein [Carboxydochorda subterranea]|uniref:Vitamin K epoxide reductase family protein n=1 Tax=Carboxydichorda subterranea TaxID=3109565 RepID=A0ABZ1BTI9_9FIRM|nr:vitamin K epoxide reductase family protein [Limnochorda sp. L945t]WRP16097.1 vitamin K epoxide reductase family protein [Limnochorda sp. L945t]
MESKHTSRSVPAGRGGREGRRRRTLLGVAAGLSVLGALVALYLLVVETGQAPGEALFCGPGSGCEANWQSPFARMAGVPLALWGLAGYVALLASAWWALRAGQGPGLAEGAGLVLSWGGALFSLYLLGVQAWAVQSFCPWCTLSAAVMVALAVMWTFEAKVSQVRLQPMAPVAGLLLGAGLAALNYLPASALGPGAGPEGLAGASAVEVSPAGQVAGDAGRAVTSLQQLEALMTAGKPGAPVLIEVYSDFQCPYCARAAQEVVHPLLREEVAQGKARLAYRNFAFIGPESKWAAEAAACAAVQGKFWEFHDLLFANQQGENVGAFSQERLIQMARQLGLDVPAFTGCLESRRMRPWVEASYEQGREKGVRATPTFFINGKRYDGLMPLEELRRIAFGSSR